MGLYFDDIHATCDTELRGLPCGIADSVAVAVARRMHDYYGYIELGKALSAQLRYHEAAEAYSMALLEKPDDLNALRLRGGRYLSSLQAEKAYEDLSRCLALGGDALDIEYRLGLCCFFLGQYDTAMKHLETAFPLADDEMGIAIIYWHTLSAHRYGTEPRLLAAYRTGMDVGHHFAYEKAMSVWAGAVTPESALDALGLETDDLHFGITAYGLSLYLEHCGRQTEAQALMKEHLRRDSFWISFAYLAAWNDKNGGRNTNVQS